MKCDSAVFVTHPLKVHFSHTLVNDIIARSASCPACTMIFVYKCSIVLRSLLRPTFCIYTVTVRCKIQCENTPLKLNLLKQESQNIA